MQLATGWRKRGNGMTQNLSAACGAWEMGNGCHAHDECTGRIALPSPQDVCECECHDTYRHSDDVQRAIDTGLRNGAFTPGDPGAETVEANNREAWRTALFEAIDRLPLTDDQLVGARHSDDDAAEAAHDDDDERKHPENTATVLGLALDLRMMATWLWQHAKDVPDVYVRTNGAGNLRLYAIDADQWAQCVTWIAGEDDDDGLLTKDDDDLYRRVRRSFGSCSLYVFTGVETAEVVL